MADPTQPQSITDILRAQNAAQNIPVAPRPPANLGGYDPFKSAVKLGSGTVSTGGVITNPASAVPAQPVANAAANPILFPSNTASAPATSTLPTFTNGASDTAAQAGFKATPLADGSNASNFMATYGDAATRAGTELNVDPNLVAAQWAHETRYGQSVIPGTNNLGNVKDYSGGGVPAVDNIEGTTSNYRAFQTPDDFADHYINLMKTKYPGVVGSGSDASAFTNGLVGGPTKYATDPGYAAKIAGVYSTFGHLGSTPGGGTASGPLTASGGNANLPTVSYGTNTPLQTQAGALRGAGLVDPSSAIDRGYAQQLAYQRASLNNIMNAAGEGDSRNYSFRLAHLVGALGQNNFGQVQGQGADALNTATAGVGNEGLIAGAQAYGQDTQAATARAQIEAGRELEANKSQPIGTTVDTSAGYPVSQTNYGMVRNGKVTPLAPDATAGRAPALPPGLKVGAPSKQKDGVYSVGNKKVTIQNGSVAGIE